MTTTRRERREWSILACEEQVVWYTGGARFEDNVQDWMDDDAEPGVLNQFSIDVQAWIVGRQKARKARKEAP